jgi:GAF domain-containing protein
MPDLPEPKPQADQPISCTNELLQQIQQQQALNSIVDRIRSCLKLDDILKTTATETRQLLNADRVGVFWFIPGSQWHEGEFVAEDVAAEFPSAMATRIYDHCFGSQYAPDYTQGKVQAVTDIYTAGFSDCHVQILERFQVRGNLIVPVLKNEELWGLICVHQCSCPRSWQPTEIEFVRKIATYFAVALQQAEQLEQIKSQAALVAQVKAQEKALARQKALVKITNRIRQSLDFADICRTTTEEVRQLLGADRVTIYRFNSDWSGDFLCESITPGWKPLVGVLPSIEDTYLMETQGGRYANNETFAVSDIYTVGHQDCHVQLLEEFQARAYAIAPIFEDQRLWGLLTAFQNSSPRDWQEDEVQLLAQIGEQLGIALKQAEFVRKIQAQSTALQQTLEELKQSQIQLVQNEKMASLGQLVAGIAHEINNPVNFIHGNLVYVNEYVSDLLTLARFYRQADTLSQQETETYQALLEEADLDFILQDLPKALASMQVGTKRIRDIVLSLRNFSRLDEAEFKTVNLHEGIDSTLLILEHQIKCLSAQTAVDVVKKYGNIPCVDCYPAQLNQVFMNILTNALDALEAAIHAGKFSPKNSSHHQVPRIWINTTRYGLDQVEIKIYDNGIGIDEKHHGKIFDHFFTTKSVGKGTGLGLAIARQIVVEKHQGELCFHSVLGQGTEFMIRLPIQLKKQ